MNAPLGTLRSWVLDGMLVGTLLPPAVLGTLALADLSQRSGLPAGACVATLVTTAIGAGLGAGLGPAAWALASWSWRVPLLATALGPAFGALCACAASWLLQGAMGGGDGRTAWFWLRLAMFGAFVGAPPWVLYVSVRSRGRSGTPLVMVTPCWAVFSAITFAAVTWLRQRWGE